MIVAKKLFTVTVTVADVVVFPEVSRATATSACVPFALMLLAVAFLPLVAGHWWESNRNKLRVSLLLGVPTTMFLWFFVDHGSLHMTQAAREYLGFIALVEAIDDVRRADHAGALLAVIGSVNVPIIYFSVRWWNTLHQGATISATAAPKMASTMLTAMLLMTLAFWAYAFAVVFMRARAIVLERERHTDWARDIDQGRVAARGAS